MKFGPVPVHDALGAILAHSVPLGAGRLRKGRVLDAADLSRLSQAGLTEITVARLDPDDLHEDTAAARLAQALVPDPNAAGLRLGQAATGRVNVTAAGPGVVKISAAAIEACNAVHPMITVATVPPWQRVTTGTMVATVKIISYGVPAADIDRVCALAKAALILRPPRLATATLIQTSVQGAAPGKGYDAMQGRLAALDVALGPEIHVPHQIAPLRDAITASQADLILILTGSATSDIADTAPSAVVAAGGTVSHFGMPVDPGNLLFLGDIAGKPVIGLPGCARSPALNGADWVLERTVCGVPVTPADIAGLGVGGLLKDIPTRPLPRRNIDHSKA